MKKIIINKCYGGFGFSQKLIKEFQKEYPQFVEEYKDEDEDQPELYLKLAESGYNRRTHPKLIELLEQLEGEGYGDSANLKIVEIPEDVKYTIQENDGIEWVAEVHRTWS